MNEIFKETDGLNLENNKDSNNYEDSNNSDQILELFLENNIDFGKFWKILVSRYSSDLSSLSVEQQLKLLKDRSLYILPESDLFNKLKESKETNKPLKVKFWIDPTWSQVHLWHAVPMVLLNKLQRMWHDIVFVIWDFTAKIWDPTWRSSSRPSLTDEQIKDNLSTYKSQVSPFFDMSKATMLNNWEWLRKVNLNDLIGLLSQVSVSWVLQRDDFRKRLDEWSWLSMAEILYPIVMGMDSVKLKELIWCDIELWGKDQFLNMQMCRKLMDIKWQWQEVIISTDILQWISWDWKKMSKSLNNYIALNDKAEDIFGKIMSIPDNLLEVYYKSLTEISNLERDNINDAISKWKLNPMNLKRALAKILIEMIYNQNEAKKAEDIFNNKFSTRDYWSLDTVSEVIGDDITVLDYIFSKLGISKSEIRRTISGNWVSLIFKDNKTIKISDGNLKLVEFFDEENREIMIKIGKKNVFKISKE